MALVDFREAMIEGLLQNKTALDSTENKENIHWKKYQISENAKMLRNYIERKRQFKLFF